MILHEIQKRCHYTRMFFHFLLCVLLISNSQLFLAHSSVSVTDALRDGWARSLHHRHLIPS